MDDKVNKASMEEIKDMKIQRHQEHLQVHLRKKRGRKTSTDSGIGSTGASLFQDGIELPNTIDDDGIYVRLESKMNKFLILKYACETIQGILTICEQDFGAPALLDDTLYSFVSVDSVQVYTTEHLLHHFYTGEMEKDQYMSANSVVASIDKTRTFTVIVVEDNICASVVNSLKSSGIRNTGVLIVGDFENLPVIQNVFIGITQSDKLVKEADYVLERCAFGILKTAITNLQQFESSHTLSALVKTNIQEMYNQVKAYFKKCAIPDPEWTDIPQQNYEYPKNIDQAIEVIKVIRFIIGCVKKSGRLQIYIEASAADSEVEEHIRRELNKYEVREYDFVYRTVEPLCSSGDSAFGGRGTLGGFVKKVKLPDPAVDSPLFEPMTGAVASSATSCTLVALIARHVADGSGSEYLTVGNTSRPIGRIVRIHTPEAVDVLPVDVYEECERYCDTRFKTDLNVIMTVTRLATKEDIQNQIGANKPVHLWGAMSAPGLGTLTPEIFHSANGDCIKIRDRRSGVSFAQRGDSGAMVCYFDAHKDKLYALGMLVEVMMPRSESQNREYVAQILDIALQKLSIPNGYELKFIDNEDY